MLTTEIQQDTHSGPVTLNPRWLRIPAAVKYSGLSRSKLYELLSEGRIKSICLKAHKGAMFKSVWVRDPGLKGKHGTADSLKAFGVVERREFL